MSEQSPVNRELLGRQWEFNVSFDEILKLKHNELKLYAKAPNASQRAAMIRSLFDFVAYQHLGFGDVPEIREQVEMGVELSVDYFCGDWWTREGVCRLDPETKKRFHLDNSAQLKDTIDRNAMSLDKSHPQRLLEWYSGLRGGLFLGALTGRWNEVVQICSWFDATIEPEFCSGTIEDELFQLYVAIACSLNPKPVDDIDELLDKVRKSRRRRPRLLCAAWDAVMAADQAAFAKAFKDTVKEFVSKPSPITVAYEWVAMNESIIWLIAEQRGLRFPTMPDKYVAAIVTPQSLGFAE